MFNDLFEEAKKKKKERTIHGSKIESARFL